jgi:hypothetical protein
MRSLSARWFWLIVETLALLLSRGLLCADRDDHANGSPLGCRPTPRLLQLLGAENTPGGETGDGGKERRFQAGANPRIQAAFLNTKLTHSEP